MAMGGMRCSQCGAQTNHQADKLTHAVTAEEASTIDATLDGVIESIFACPNCGWIDSRRTASSPR
jgi:transcription elongation factor Elf1